MLVAILQHVLGVEIVEVRDAEDSVHLGAHILVRPNVENLRQIVDVGDVAIVLDLRAHPRFITRGSVRWRSNAGRWPRSQPGFERVSRATQKILHGAISLQIITEQRHRPRPTVPTELPKPYGLATALTNR